MFVVISIRLLIMLHDIQVFKCASIGCTTFPSRRLSFQIYKLAQLHFITNTLTMFWSFMICSGSIRVVPKSLLHICYKSVPVWEKKQRTARAIASSPLSQHSHHATTIPSYSVTPVYFLRSYIARRRCYPHEHIRMDFCKTHRTVLYIM